MFQLNGKGYLSIFGLLLMAAMACTISFPGAGDTSAADKTLEGYYLQDTLQAQLTQMGGAASINGQPKQAVNDTPEPPIPCRIAFHSEMDGDTGLYLLDAQSANLRRLGTEIDWHASWSPDGQHIAFVSERDGNNEIYVMAADGSSQRRLTNNASDDYWPEWSPKGDVIAFTSNRGDKRKLFLINPDGSGERQLSPDNSSEDTHATWSPDGSRLGFASNRDGDWDIFVMNADGSAVQQLVNNKGTDWNPGWSPDGTRLVFASERDGDYEIYIINTDSSGSQRLTFAQGDDWNPDWSPDGVLITFISERSQNEDIFIMDADGGNQRALINTTSNDESAVFSPQCTAVDVANWQYPASDLQPETAPAEESPAEAAPAEPPELIRDVGWNRTAFYCVKSDGPTTLTFTADMSDVDRGLAIFWRLYEKNSGTQTDWKNVSMQRKGGSERIYTFNANAFDSENNFTYPPLMGESWFQVQFVSGDGQDRTEVFRDDITFFPCAQ